MTTSVNVFAPVNSMTDKVIWVWKWFTHYQVVMAESSNGYARTWWARDEADVLNWMRVCKPKCSVAYGKRGKLLGGRRGV